MCTLTLAWHVFDGVPIVVAANRDEALGRQAAPPTVYSEQPRIVAPRDLEAGGTWIGVNEHGVFAGITNRWIDGELVGERSRGLLVGDVLACGSTTEAISLVETTIDEYEYDAFNLVVADASDAVALEWDGTLERTRFDPGVHVVVNVGVDDRFSIPSTRSDVGNQQAENARRVRSALEAKVEADADDRSRSRSQRPDSWLERAADVLSDHEYGVCVHGDGFGTRSSSLLAISDSLRYEFADGPPCRTDYGRVEATLEVHGQGSKSESNTR